MRWIFLSPFLCLLLSYGVGSEDRLRRAQQTLNSSEEFGIFYVKAAFKNEKSGETVENKKMGLTNDRRSCKVTPNRKQNRYDDREKISPERYRELPGAARQRKRGRCYWPLSTSAEPASLVRRERVSSPLPERRNSSSGAGLMPKAGIFYANRSGTAEVQAFVSNY